MRLVATIEDPVVIWKILTHLGLPTEASAPRPSPVGEPSERAAWRHRVLALA